MSRLPLHHTTSAWITLCFAEAMKVYNESVTFRQASIRGKTLLRCVYLIRLSTSFYSRVLDQEQDGA